MTDRPKRWNVRTPHAAADELAAALRVSPLVAQVLINRGVTTPDDCGTFLRPSLKCLHEPALLPNLPVAAERIARAIRDKHKIVVYGDYDVDGITATAILWHAITRLGGVVDYYIPHRVDEGYGLNGEAIAQLCDDGAGLIVTVDCGVTAHAPAAVARDRNVDLVITDHHEWHEQAAPLTTTDDHGPILPRAYAVVHPRLPVAGADPYPNPHLCGAGVAFKLAWGIGQAVTGNPRVGDDFRAFLVEATALAALGTIADVVPLVGENRVLAAFGLGGLRESKLVGVRALIDRAGLTGQDLDSYAVGFRLAPRLNACGRMGHARLAVELLTKADPARATEIAAYLEAQNRERQATERDITRQAVEQVRQLGYDRDDCRAIVVGGPGWHPGVIGIVASRIVDKFHRPAVVVALDGDHGQGSGRSIAGFHLAHALEACGDHLDAYGGHEMAAGLKVRADRFDAFRAAFTSYACGVIPDDLLVPQLHIDATAELPQLTGPLVRDLRRLGPFGHGNRRPVLCVRGLEVSFPPRRVGKDGNHLQLYVRQGAAGMKCVAFNSGHLFDRLQPGARVDLAVEPSINEFNGRATVELEVRDVRFG